MKMQNTNLAHQLHVSDSAGIQIIPFRQKERG
jgi:hypothetical protein